MASLQFHAAVLLSVGLMAGCGGNRNRGAADTTGAAMPADTSAAPGTGAATPVDTGSTAAPAAADTAATSSATPSDSGTKRAAQPSPARTKVAARPRTAHADVAKPAPAPTPQQQDTAKAQDTSKAQDTAKAQDTSTAAAAQQDQPLRDAYHQPPRDTVDQATYDGWKQFNLNCARCHGEDALGTTIAPHLIMSLKPDGPINTKELFMQTVCAGRPAKGMPAWCALGLGMDKISDIYLYVKGRSDAKISPGRPAVKSGG